jgi:ATP-dependent protease Clp ATPase subunit
LLDDVDHDHTVWFPKNKKVQEYLVISLTYTVLFEELEPLKVVEHLDKYVVGQEKAKSMLAIALRE